MALNFIDISHHNGNVPLSELPIDGAICKATQGTSFTDNMCDKYVQQLIKLGKLWGFYHFADRYDPIKECEHFLNATVGYRGTGVPALDWEGVKTADGFYMQPVSYVNDFVRYYHKQTGVWPWVYSNPSWFKQGGVESNCGRWVAKWPKVIHPSFDYNPFPIPDADGLVCAWQYASDGRIGSYNQNLDINKFYGTREAWLKYAKAGYVGEVETPSNSTSVLENDEYRITVERK